MNERTLMQMLWAGALIVLVIAAGMTAKSFSETSEISERLQRKLGDVEELRTIEQEMARYDGAKLAFDELPAVQANSLRALLKTMLASYKIDDSRVMQRESVPGWTVLQNEIAFTEVPFAEVMKFVCEAERQRPPWRLAKCDIRASAQASGSGQVVLLMETMVKE
jgi:hypothetical protein